MSEPKIAIAILTCDRRQFGGTENYFPRMWESMRKSGLMEQRAEGDAIGIFDAGPQCLDWIKECYQTTGIKPSGSEYWRLPTRLKQDGIEYWRGPSRSRLDLIRNTHRAFSWMLMRGCDYGIWLPDDVICVKNWLPEVKHWLAECVPPGGAGYGLAARYPWTRYADNLARRWSPYPGELMWFSICAIPAAVISGYLLSDQRQKTEESDVGTDWIVRFWGYDHGLPIYAHCPDLFTDIGVDSTIAHPWVKGPHNLMFPGEDYDALAGGPVDLWPEIERKWQAMEREGATP